MPDDDLAQRAAELHRRATIENGADEPFAYCQDCTVPWPCLTHKLAAALVAQEGQADPQADLSTTAIQQRAPFAYGQWRVDLTTLLERLAAAEGEADRWCLTATAEKRKHEQAEAALAAEQAARGRAEAALRQYADADNWADTRGVDWLSRWVGDDEGPAIARAALAGEEGQ